MKPRALVLVGLGSAVFVALGCRSGETSNFEKVASRYDATVKEARAAGIILTTSELQAVVDERADPALSAKFIDSLERFNEAKEEIGFNGTVEKIITDDLPQNRAFIGAMLNELSPRLDEIKSIVTSSDVALYRDWTKGNVNTMTFPVFARLKDAVKSLTARAQWHAKNGRIDEAVSDLRAAVKVGNVGSTEPVVNGHLIDTACTSIVSRSWEKCLTDLKGSQEFLEKSKDLYGSVPQKPTYWNFAGQLLMRLSVYGKKDRLDPKTFSSEYQTGIKLPNVQMELMVKAFKVRSIESAIKLKKAVESPTFLSSREILNNIDGELRTTKDSTMALESVLAPVFSNATAQDYKAINLMLMQRAMIDVLTFKNKNGRYPKTLLEAGFKNNDRFSDQPFKYKATDKGVIIYSVNQDLMDNGGRTNSSGGGTDLPLVYPYAPPKTEKSGGGMGAPK